MSYSDHAPLAPSSAARWMQCGGSRALEALYPEDDISPKAAEGTLAHTVVAARMRGENEPGGTDEDMREAADMFEDEVYAQVPRGTVLKVEYRVKMPSIHPENYGTPDCFSIDPVKRKVHVWDFKYGHRYVDVYRNWQLLDYAWGALTDHGMPTAAELRDWSVRLCIVQPRYFAGPPVRDWSITGYELYEYAGKLAVGARHAMRDDAPTVANDECLDCKARVPCRALALTAGAIRD